MTTKWEINRAVRASDLPAPSRLIMFVLSDIADAGTAEIPERHTPSLTVLARETGLGRSTVAEHLAALEEGGWLDRLRPDVTAARLRGDRTCYRLLAPKVEPSVQELDHVVQEADQGGSPGAGLDVVQELDGSSPGAGHKEKDLNDHNNLSSSSAKPPKTGKKLAAKKPAKRACRIPVDFTVTPDMIAWARANTPLVGAAETAKFIDYWTARPGKDGLKLDWIATWRNWMRNAQQRAEAQATRASPFATPASSAPERIPDDERCPVRDHQDQRARHCRHCAALRKAGHTP